jgi:hypothetical protein
MRAAAWIAPDQLSLVDRPDPVAGAGQAVVGPICTHSARGSR